MSDKNFMVKTTLVIDSLTDVKEFHNFICRLSSPVILSRENFKCDATSLLGVFALDTSIPFEIEYDIHEQEFDRYITKFRVIE